MLEARELEATGALSEQREHGRRRGVLGLRLFDERGLEPSAEPYTVQGSHPDSDIGRGASPRDESRHIEVAGMCWTAIDGEALCFSDPRLLKLEDVDPSELKDDDPLFGEGLGLDSLDAVELVVLLQKIYQVEIKDMEQGREVFATIRTLADHIRAVQAGQSGQTG